MDELSDEELLAELGIEPLNEKKAQRTPREERIIAGFEDVQKFVETHKHAPQHGEDRDIFERLYAVRLYRIREQAECRELVAPLDYQGLLKDALAVHANATDDLDDDALLSELGVHADDAADITVLKHVKSRAEVRAAEEIANRTPCADFDTFKPLFSLVQRDLDAGTRATRPFERKSEIEAGRFFIVGGQKAYVAHKGELFAQPYGDLDSRLRVIFDNGTESDMLMRSLQRALTKDETGRRITEPSAGPLFGHVAEDGDLDSGTIYVLRSKSSHPTIAANRELIHKIGVTGRDLDKRIANAQHDATFLLADVETIATYTLYNVNRAKLENLLHRVFAAARLDLEIKDRFGRPVKPREWFLVPLSVIDDVVDKIRDQSISDFEYDPTLASLKKPAAR